MRIIAMTVIGLGVMTGGLGFARAQSPPPSPSQPPSQSQPAQAMVQDSVTAIDRAADQTVAQRLAKTLGMDASTLQTQRTQTKLGWGDLVIANRLAQATGFSFTKIVDEFQRAKAWEPVVQDHAADLGKLIGDARQARAALEAAEKPKEAPARDTAADQPQPKQGKSGSSGGGSHRRGGFGIPGFGGSGTNP
jgi:hypothetical protein